MQQPSYTINGTYLHSANYVYQIPWFCSSRPTGLGAIMRPPAMPQADISPTLATISKLE